MVNRRRSGSKGTRHYKRIRTDQRMRQIGQGMRAYQAGVKRFGEAMRILGKTTLKTSIQIRKQGKKVKDQ